MIEGDDLLLWKSTLALAAGKRFDAEMTGNSRRGACGAFSQTA
jgi:hypothetical protein